MNTDADVGELIKRSVATLEPRTAILVAGGIERGRRKERRRDAAQALSGLALAGLIAGVVLGVTNSSPSPAHGAPAAGASRSAPGSTSASRTGRITPQVVARTAVDLLPRHGTISKLGGSSSLGWAGAQFVYDDGRGAALIYVSVDYTPAGSGLGAACQISTCRRRLDGSRRVRQGQQRAARQGVTHGS